MKKAIQGLIVISAALCGTLAHSGAQGPVGPENNWQGIYVGGNIGYAWSSMNWDYTNINPYSAFATLPPLPLPISTNFFDTSNTAGGLQVGYNYQMNSWIIGPEFAYFWTDLNKQQLNAGQPLIPYENNIQTLNSHIDQYLTVSGRIGKLIRPAWLFYGKAGYAGAHIETAGITTPPLIFPPNVHLDWNTSQWHNGWVLGTGIEWMLRPNITVGAEYTYMGYEDVIHTGAVSGGIITPSNQVLHQVNANIQSVMARINYLFAI